MKESQRIIKLFNDLYEGSPWIGENIKGTLENISAEKAARKIIPGKNSIWEIAIHMVRWRETLLERLQGNKIPSPDHNYFEPVTDRSNAAWKKTLEELKASQVDWINFLEVIDEPTLEKNYDDIQGIIQHDAYHLGQVVMMGKMA